MSLLDNPHTWYVGFCKSSGDLPWFQRQFTKPEWSHCFCFAQVGPYVQVLNPGWDRLEIGIRAADDGGALEVLDFAKKLSQDGITVLRVTHAPERIKIRSIWMPSCVSFVKTVLGYNTKWTCWNPERLCVNMLHNGAELIKGDLAWV